MHTILTDLGCTSWQLHTQIQKVLLLCYMLGRRAIRSTQPGTLKERVQMRG